MDRSVLFLKVHVVQVRRELFERLVFRVLSHVDKSHNDGSFSLCDLLAISVLRRSLRHSRRRADTKARLSGA